MKTSISLINDLTVIVNGPVYSYTKKYLEEYSKRFKVIFSTGEDDGTTNFPCEIIKNKYPDKAGKGNINRQIVTSLSGLSKVDTKYCIRVRSDILIKDIDRWINFCSENKKSGRVFCLGLNHHEPFAPRDQIFIGETSVVKSVFDIPLTDEDYCHNVTSGSFYAELYLGIHFYSKFDEMAQICLNNPSVVKSNMIKRYWSNLKADLMFPLSKHLKYEWPKHYPNGFSFELAKKYGEFWYEDLTNFKK